MRVVPVPCLSDNYAYLVIADGGDAAIVDPGEAQPVLAAVEREGVRLIAVWATHHHPDHVGGVGELVAAVPGLAVVAHVSDKGRITSVTRTVDDGDVVELAELRARVIHNPGHTLGAISFVVTDPTGPADAGAIFTGDTLFGAGCGRMFEGTPEMMARSLARIAAEAPALEVYFGHEYTVSNLRFAAAVSPDDPAVAARAAEAAAARAAGRPTTPSTIGLERATNPFLRGAEPAVAAAAHAHDPTADTSDAASVFGALRRWKDTFR
jgi:hydroxyacylglutathione hydrolase